MSEIVEFFKSQGELLKQVYFDVAQPGVKQVGQALETVLGLTNTILLPLKLLNENARVNFNCKMEKYRERIKHLSDDEVCNVPPEIGMPILDKFTYISDNDISELFINLLSKASCKDTVKDAHPRFISLINSLSVDEANLLFYLSKQDSSFLSIQFMYQKKPQTQKISHLGLTKFELSTTRELSGILSALEKKVEFLFPDNISMYLDNFLSLGIITHRINDTGETFDEELFKDMQRFYNYGNEYIDCITDPETESIVCRVGKFEITSYGLKFIEVCCKKLMEE